MTTPRIFIAIPADVRHELGFAEVIADLQTLGDVVVWDESASQLDAMVTHATVCVTGWGTPHLSALADWSTSHSNLQLVVHTAGTVKHLIPEAAMHAGLLVSHANAALADSVAEFTVGALIMARRQVFAAAQRYRDQQPVLPIQMQHELRGSIIGIVGASAIGRRVMDLLRVFGVQVLLADPYASPELAAQYQATLVSLDTLLQQSDVVSLHAPVTPETLDMMGAREFALMRDGAWFINTARGRLVDADAMFVALQSGRIHALIDVTEPNEPLPAHDPLWTLPNCVILPHMAAVTQEARVRQRTIAVDEVMRFVRGESLQHLVSLAQWQTMA